MVRVHVYLKVGSQPLGEPAGWVDVETPETASRDIAQGLRELAAEILIAADNAPVSEGEFYGLIARDD